MEHLRKPLSEMSESEVSGLVETLEQRNAELVEEATDELREMGEFGRVQLSLEDIGWQPLIGMADSANSFTLDGLHRISELCRAVAVVNPLVERGLQVRTGYIWGSGVQVVAQEFVSGGPGRPRRADTEPRLPDGLDDVLTGPLAQMEIEHTAATDGNLFFLVDRRRKTVQRIPFEEITEGVSERGNRERLLYIRRTWNDWDLELDAEGDREFEPRPVTEPDPQRHGFRPRAYSGNCLNTDDWGGYRYRQEWYPTEAAHASRASRRSRSHIGGDPVNHDKIMVHVAFNRLSGWRWGIPDVLPAVWWTKAYKEFLENAAVLTKAYARFAWKVTSERSRGVRRTAATLAQTPRTDPSTGQPLAVGASAVLGAGQDLSAVGRNTTVDFDAGRPLAAMVAASLDVPLPALTEDPTLSNRSAAQALDVSTVLVMQARQKVMNSVYERIFRLLGLKVRLRWPDIEEQPIHRRLQAIDMAVRMGLFSAAESRLMVLEAWRDKWDDFPHAAPAVEDLPLAVGGGGQGVPGDARDQGRGGLEGTGGPGAPGALNTGNQARTPSSSGDLAAPRQPDPMSRGDHELRREEPGEE